MTAPDVRWKQRFQSYDRAFVLLRTGLQERPLAERSALEKEGLIQRFELTYELGWKLLKDFLEAVVARYLGAFEAIHEAFMARSLAP